MNLELAGRRAIVTGGSRGIGLAVARGLASEGASVALVARGAADLEEAARALSGVAVAVDAGLDPALAAREPHVIGVPTDTGSDDSVAAMVSRVVDELGGVDILVNAAATPNRGGFGEDTLEDELNVKVRGYLRCARAVAPIMVAQGWGRIVNVSGLAARQTGSVVGSVRNVAVAALTKNLADELGPSGVNVTVVHPGPTVTERVPPVDASDVSIGRLVTAAEVANVIVFLCSPRSVAINGDAIAVGGGARGLDPLLGVAPWTSRIGLVARPAERLASSGGEFGRRGEGGQQRFTPSEPLLTTPYRTHPLICPKLAGLGNRTIREVHGARLDLRRRPNQHLVDRHPPRPRDRVHDRVGDIRSHQLLHPREEVLVVVLDRRPLVPEQLGVDRARLDHADAHVLLRDLLPQ